MSLKSLVAQLFAGTTAIYVIYAYLVRFERWAMGRMVLRGNRRRGMLWPLVDASRALLKPSVAPPGVRGAVYRLSPVLTLSATVTALALLPVGPAIEIVGFKVPLWGTNLDVSLLVALPLTWLSLLSLLAGGWASGRPLAWKESCLVVRQAWRYSLPALLSLCGPVMLAGSFSLEKMVRAQSDALPYITYQPLGLLVFALALLLGSRRLPFKPPGPQSRLLSDYYLQHSEGVLAMYHLAEYVHLFFISALISTVYLAGWQGPWRDGFHWLVLKALLVVGVLLWLRDGWLAQQSQQSGERMWFILTLLALLNSALTATVLAWSR